MATYISSIPLPPKVMSEREQTILLKVTGERRGAFRDHVLLSLALASALREHELVALDVGDVVDAEGVVRRRLVLRVFKRSSSNPAPQEVPLCETVRLKLGKFLEWKKRHGQSIEARAPLFVSRRHCRLSTRQVRHSFAEWQKRAGFERHYGFHSVRHAACTSLYRQTKDIRLVQRFARHKSILTSMRYAHPDEAELVRALQQIPC